MWAVYKIWKIFLNSIFGLQFSYLFNSGYNSPKPSQKVMEHPRNFGIAALELYIPKPFVDMNKFGKRQSDPEIYNRVPRGKYTTGLGQQKMSFVSENEDPVSLAMNGSFVLTQPWKDYCAEQGSPPTTSED